jgi:hypothetical protein
MGIQPRSFGESLNVWFRVLGRRWRPLLLNSLLAFVPLAVTVFLAFVVTGAHNAFAALMDPETLETLTEEEILDLFTPFLWVGAVWVILQIGTTVFVSVSSTRIVAEDLAQIESSPSELAGFAWSRLLRGVGAALALAIGFTLLAGIVVIVGLVTFSAAEANFLTVFLVTALALTAMVVMVWIGLSVSLYAQVLACEDAGSLGSLRRSFRLVQGRWWVTAGFLVVVGLIVSAVSQVLGIVLLPAFLAGLAEPLFLALAYGISLVLYGPLTAALAAAYAVWYIDLRARKEPLTTEQLV